LTANTTAVTFTSALDRFDLPVFKPEWANIRRGIEKESLRVSPQGRLAQTEHPLAMGSALTHPYITTDYSEALIELITPVTQSADECIAFLTDIHKFTYDNLPTGERLWVSSMPCLLEGEEQIPLAQYAVSGRPWASLQSQDADNCGHSLQLLYARIFLAGLPRSTGLNRAFAGLSDPSLPAPDSQLPSLLVDAGLPVWRLTSSVQLFHGRA
jgi:hypothetical protein